MFNSTQLAQQTRPTTTSVARPNKKSWTAHIWAEVHHWAQCYSLNNWFRVLTGNSDARYTGYYMRGLRIRFYMIVRRLFYFCTVKGYSTGLQQWYDWRRYKGANLPPDKLNAKIESHFAYISVFSTCLVFSKLFYAFFGSFCTAVFRWF